MPNVPGAFVLQDVFSKDECVRLITMTEAIGYNPDEPANGQPGDSILAHAAVICVDEEFSRFVFDRVKGHLNKPDGDENK